MGGLFQFKTYTSAPQSKKFKELADILSSRIYFTSSRYHFLRKLQNSVSQIKKTEIMLVNADKPCSIYAVSAEDYKNPLRNNVTKRITPFIHHLKLTKR